MPRYCGVRTRLMKPLTAKLSQEANADPEVGVGEYWGDAGAGALIVAKDTGRILLFQRSDDVNEPGTWNLTGGKLDAGENPKDAVAREVEEESGLDGDYKLALVYTFRHKNFRYDNFLAIIPAEFTPKLNWEHDTSKWVEWGEWPHPMHFGLKSLLDHAGEKIHRVVTLIKRKKAGIVREMDMPPAIVQSAHEFSPEFIKYIESVENNGGTGFKNGVWKPHESAEGGSLTIAYGHKIQSGEEKLLTGISDDGAEKLLLRDLSNAKEKMYSEIKHMFGVQIPLNQVQEEMLTEYVFNLGTLKKFPKFTRAVLNKKWDIAKKEFVRSYKDKSGKSHELVRRNKMFFDKYLKSLSPRIMKRGKVPEVIREMIESQDPNRAVLFNKGISGDGIWGYELRSPKSYLRYRHEPDTKIFYLDNIGTPNQDDKNKGYAKALLETFFQLIKGQGGTLDSGPFTTSGTAYIKHVVERFAKSYGVRLVKGRDQIDESISPELKGWFGNSKVVDKHGEPLIVWKGMRWKDDAGKPITHIQRREDFPAFNRGEPGIKGIAGFFTSDQTVAKRFCFGPNAAPKPFYLKIENPFVIDMKGGFAGNAQFDKQGLPFRDAMRSGKYDGAFILNTKDEENVFVITNPSQVKLATNKTFGPDKEFAREAVINEDDEIFDESMPWEMTSDERRKIRVAPENCYRQGRPMAYSFDYVTVEPQMEGIVSTLHSLGIATNQSAGFADSTRMMGAIPITMVGFESGKISSHTLSKIRTYLESITTNVVVQDGVIRFEYKFPGGAKLSTIDAQRQENAKPAVEIWHGVEKILRQELLSEAYGDPGDHVIFGGVFYPERVVANIIQNKNSYFGHTHEHGPTRWVYYQGMKTVFWHHYPPSVPEWEMIVKEWLEKRGYPVERQTDKEQYYKLMAWYQKKGLLKEIEDSSVVLGELDRNGSNLQPVYSQDQLANHPSHMKGADRRWRYYPENGQLDWQGQPTAEEHEGTKEFLAQRGLMVKRVHYLAGSVKKQNVNEGVRLDYINRQIQVLEAEWDRLDSQGTGFDRQQQIRIEIEQLRKEKARWDKLHGAVNETLENWNDKYWIHYSDVDYAKVNPNPSQSHYAPRGVYLFPLKLESLDLTRNPIGEYWSRKKYKITVKVKHGLNILDLVSLSVKDCARILIALGHKDKIKLLINHEWLGSLPFHNAGHVLWIILEEKIFNDGRKFSDALLKIGYDGVFGDRNTIFANEIQLIIFDDHNIDVVKVELNDLKHKRATGTLLMESKRATPRQLEEFLREQIKGTEWDGKVFAVGGFVRDELLGKEPKDLDLVVGKFQGGVEFTTWLGQKLGIYKQGSNPVIFPTFGTANLRLDGVIWNGVDFSGESIDAVMFRKEQYHDPNTRKPTVQFTPHIEVDAERRDITFNAIYKDIASGKVIDPTGKGLADLKSKVVRTAIDPTIIYTDDALRMFRAVRFAAQLGFELSPDIVDGIKKNLHRLHNTSKERMRDELNKILLSKGADRGLRLLRDTGLLAYLSPDLQKMVGMTQNVHHSEDVFGHTLSVLMGTQPELVRRLIALFHDIGKVVTRSETPSGVHFYGHEEAGPEVIERVMMELKYPRILIDAVKLGTRHHMKLKHGGDDAINLTDKSLRKFKIAIGQYLEHVLDVIHADNVSHASASAMPNQVAAVRKRLDTLDIKEVDKPVLPITGNDLIAIGIKPGPMIGKMLSAVTEAWYENPSITKNQAMQIVRQMT